MRVAENRLHTLEQKLLEAEATYGLQSGEAGNALIALVDFLKTQPGTEDRIKRLNERIDEIYEIYKAACED